MQSTIHYSLNDHPTVDEVIELYDDSGLRRPTYDRGRIAEMLRHANLTVSARLDGKLVGLARSLTDFSYCCYLSDLAVSKALQHQGIGTELVRLTKREIGDRAMLLLLSAPDAMEYYPKIGMERVENGFIIKRTI
ncbi:MAG: GNAT family N-acetyltransferase [Bacteroidetes bacterium]|nr:GNAT family N-acetyltransferase [Bacteroidota bacterium]